MNADLYATWLAAPGDDRASIYFAQAGPYLKVGFSRNVDARIAALRGDSGQTIKPADLKQQDIALIGVIPGTPQGERLIHSLLREHRVAGEWFHVNDETTAHVAMWLKASEPMDRAS